MEALIMVISNTLFQATRTLSTRYIAEGHIRAAVTTGFFVKVLWLVSTAIGIKAVLDGNILYIILYLISGGIGDYIGMIYKRTISS